MIILIDTGGLGRYLCSKDGHMHLQKPTFQLTCWSPERESLQTGDPRVRGKITHLKILSPRHGGIILTRECSTTYTDNLSIYNITLWY